MRSDFWNYQCRNPRHVAETARTVELLLGSPHDAHAPRLEGKLVDFSRQGAQIEVAEPLVDGTAVVLRLAQLDCGLDMLFPGVVRWRHHEADSWLIGCQFDREVPLENLGELFLNEVLSKDPPPQRSVG